MISLRNSPIYRQKSFDESKHPRDDSGKFGEGGGDGAQPEAAKPSKPENKLPTPGASSDLASLQQNMNEVVDKGTKVNAAFVRAVKAAWKPAAVARQAANADAVKDATQAALNAADAELPGSKQKLGKYFAFVARRSLEILKPDLDLDNREDNSRRAWKEILAKSLDPVAKFDYADDELAPNDQELIHEMANDLEDDDEEQAHKIASAAWEIYLRELRGNLERQAANNLPSGKSIVYRQKSKDASGHEHSAETGQFTSGSGGGAASPSKPENKLSGRERLATAAAAHQKAKEEYKAALKEATGEIKAAHDESMGKAKESLSALEKSHANISGVHETLDDLATAIADHPEGGSLREQFDSFESIANHAKDAEYALTKAPKKAAKIDPKSVEAATDAIKQAGITDEEKRKVGFTRIGGALPPGEIARAEDVYAALEKAGVNDPGKAMDKMVNAGLVTMLGIGKRPTGGIQTWFKMEPQSKGTSAVEIAANKQHFAGIISAAKEGKEHIRAASKARKEMRQIKSGKPANNLPK